MPPMTHIYPNSIATPVASAPPSLNCIAYYVRIHSSLHPQPAPPSPLIPPALPFAKRQEYFFTTLLNVACPTFIHPTYSALKNGNARPLPRHHLRVFFIGFGLIAALAIVSRFHEFAYEAQTERPHLVQFAPSFRLRGRARLRPSYTLPFPRDLASHRNPSIGFFFWRNDITFCSYLPQRLSHNHLFILILSSLHSSHTQGIFILPSFTTKRYFIRIRRTCLHQLPFILSCDRVVAANGTSVTKIIAGLYFFFFSLSFGRYHMVIKQNKQCARLISEETPHEVYKWFGFDFEARPSPPRWHTVIFARLLSALRDRCKTPRARRV